MRLAAIRSWAALVALVVSLVISTCGIALAGTEEDAHWSIDFGAVSLSEAFDQLTQITGIKIFTTMPLSHTVSPKRYRNQRIDQILRDMLKNLNYAAVWHYSERGIESIGIVAFDREEAEDHTTVSGENGVDARSRSIPKRSVPRRLRPGAQVGGSEREVSVQDYPAEMEETEGSEADERDEELEEPATEADDAAKVAPSEAQVEPGMDSSNGEGGPPEDQQNGREE